MSYVKQGGCCTVAGSRNAWKEIQQWLIAMDRRGTKIWSLHYQISISLTFRPLPFLDNLQIPKGIKLISSLYPFSFSILHKPSFNGITALLA